MARLVLTWPLARLAAALLLLAVAVPQPALAGDAPSTFEVPLPLQGDAWTYSVWQDVDASERRLVQRSFTQAGPEVARAADGRLVGTAALVETQTWSAGDDEPTTEVWTYQVGPDGRAVAATWLRDGPGAQSRNEFTGIPALGTVTEEVAEHPVVATTLHRVEPLCGHRSALQGQAVRLAGVRIDGCPTTESFVPIAKKTWGSQDAVVLGLASAPETLQLWFVADVPVPVRIVDLRDEAAIVQELVAFTAGHAALAYGTPMGAAAPAIASAPRPAHGLPEEGVQHPFPLSAAYAAALGATGSDLATFVANQRGSYLQAATFTDLRINQHSHTEHQRTWLLVVSDGSAAAAVQVTQTTVERDGLPVPVGLPSQAPTVGDAHAGEGPWPAPSAVPGSAPTVASLLRRWEATTSDAGPANAWGFRLGCGETCAQATLQAWAGRDDRTQPNEPQVGFAVATIVHRDADLMAVDGDGATAWVEQVRFEREYSLTGVPLLATGDPPQTAAVPVPAEPEGLQVPWAGVAAAGAAIGAALVVAWLVKAGPLAALFSRHIHDVTANPVRKAVLDAVRAEPGIHHSELLRRVGKGNSVVTNHVRRLAAAGLVTQRQGSRFLCYFPAGTTRPALLAAPLMKSAVAQRILAAAAAGPVSGQEIAQRIGVEPGAITYHAQRLGQAGLLTSRREGRFVLLEATPLGREAAAAAA